MELDKYIQKRVKTLALGLLLLATITEDYLEESADQYDYCSSLAEALRDSQQHLDDAIAKEKDMLTVFNRLEDLIRLLVRINKLKIHQNVI